MPKQQAEGTAPFSHTRHMQELFDLFLKTDAGNLLQKGQVTRSDLYAVFCAGYTEGVWTERAHPGYHAGGMRKG